MELFVALMGFATFALVVSLILEDRQNERLMRAIYDKPLPDWQEPVCPACGSIYFIKIARNEDGNCRVHCLDCGEEAALTNEEYYGWK